MQALLAGSVESARTGYAAPAWTLSIYRCHHAAKLTTHVLLLLLLQVSSNTRRGRGNSQLSFWWHSPPDNTSRCAHYHALTTCTCTTCILCRTQLQLLFSQCRGLWWRCQCDGGSPTAAKNSIVVSRICISQVHRQQKHVDKPPRHTCKAICSATPTALS
jgi:hypothetical protein